MLAVATLLLGTLAACEYDRTNPLDPNFDLDLVLEGPDSIYSLNDTIQFEITTDPSHPELDFEWETTDAVRLQPVVSMPGKFTSLGNGTVVVSAKYGPHRVEKSVVIVQRAARLRIAAPAVAEIESLNETLTLSAAVTDAKGTPVSGTSGSITWASGDPAIAEVTANRVTARANGEVWIKAASSELADSVRVRVKQKPASIQFGNSGYTIGIPGGSVQTVLTVRDARNNVIVNPAGLTYTSSRPALLEVLANGIVRSRNVFGSADITARVDALEAHTTVRVTGGSAPLINRINGGLTRLSTSGSPTDILLVELEARDAEADLDEATIDVYSNDSFSTFLAQRLVAQEQGRPIYTSWVIVQGVPTAGFARARIRDAAGNQSLPTTQPLTCNCQAIVAPFPSAGHPDLVPVTASRVTADSISVSLTATAGDVNLRGIYLVGLDASGTVIVTSGRSLPQAAGTSATVQIGVRSADVSRVVRVGVLLSDESGRLSQIKVLPV